MASAEVSSMARHQALYKAKSSPWRETIRKNRIQRQANARFNKLCEFRAKRVQNDILEDDINLGEEVEYEQAMQEFQMQNGGGDDEVIGHYIEHPCPVCIRELHVHRFPNPSIICDPCEMVINNVTWEQFQQRLTAIVEAHDRQGGRCHGEFIYIDGNLFLGCDDCDFMDIAF